MPQGMSVEDAIYHTVHGYPGGVVALQHMSGDAAVLHAMAAALGYTAQLATPDQADGDMVEASMRLQVAFADLMRAVADPLARVAVEPAKPVTGNEVRRAEYRGHELHAAMAHMLATMRAHMRAAPRVEG